MNKTIEHAQDAEEVTTGTEVGLLADNNPRDVFKSEDRVKVTLALIEEKALAFVGDPTSAKGRKEIIAMASKVTRSKTALDGARKALTEGWRKETAAVNEKWKIIEATLDPLAERVRKPVSDWEEAEKARVEALDYRLALICTGGMDDTASAYDLATQIEAINLIEIDDAWEERKGLAAIQKVATLKMLRAYHITAVERERKEEEARVKAEADRIELDRLRHEANQRETERLAAELEDQRKAREEAAAKAEQEREAGIAREKQEAAESAAAEAAAARDREHEQLMKQAEQEAADRLAAAKAETERVRKEAEDTANKRLLDAAAERMAQAERDAEAKREREEREADETNRARIHSEIATTIADMIGDMLEVGAEPAEISELLARSIMRGELPSVTVTF